MHYSGCLICGQDLLYLEKEEQGQCFLCKKTFQTKTKCIQHHFICDACHSTHAIENIEQLCLLSLETNPVKLLFLLLENPKIKMHGPEHHFLVPAILLTCYYNAIKKPELLKEKLIMAKNRAKNILGGFCGFYGTCGAGVGTGIFISIITEANPLSKKEWQLAHFITSQSLNKIGHHGGPRCCKRNTFLALETAATFLKEELEVILPLSPILCSFSQNNKECQKKACPYYQSF